VGALPSPEVGNRPFVSSINGVNGVYRRERSAPSTCLPVDRGGTSVSRTHCTDCGFEVAAHAECPLCGHRLTGESESAGVLRTLLEV
jgi:hypothetical protein